MHVWPQTNVIITLPDQKERISWWPRGVRENQKWVERRIISDQFRDLPFIRVSSVIIENRFDICHHHQNLVEHQVTGYIYVVIGGADVCELESAHDGPEKAEKTRKPRA